MARCPRCASEVDGNRFCWMCSWDMNSGYMECGRCGGDVGNDGYCLMCGALVFTKENDEEEP